MTKTAVATGDPAPLTADQPRHRVQRTPAPPPSIEVVVGSRFGSDSVHFGLFGRVLITVILVAIPAAVLRWGGPPYSWAFVLLWGLVLLPWAFRDLWRTSKRRVRVTEFR